jgi:hypothetical protein
MHSLIATIKQKRPDLLQDVTVEVPPILEEIPAEVAKRFNSGNPDAHQELLC